MTRSRAGVEVTHSSDRTLSGVPSMIPEYWSGFSRNWSIPMLE